MPGPAGASTTTMSQIETAHSDMVHDVQLDWHGRRLATCSSDRTIKIFQVDGGSASGSNSGSGSSTLIDTLQGHTGPVWSVSWAHPKFGSILASCSYDGSVVVWREVQGGSQQPGHHGASVNGRWEKIKEHTLHGASVNAISWAPHELGPILACASSDGKVSVLTFNNDGTWDASLFAAHNIGVNAISFAPAVVPASLVSPSTGANGANNANGGQPAYVKKFATGGCDSLIKLWNYNASSNQWTLEETLEGHTDWVRDVAFSPGVGLPRTYLASCGQDKQVIVWTQDGPGQGWNRKLLNPLPYLSPSPAGAGSATTTTAGMEENKFPEPVWKVSWSVTGNVLAVSAGDGKVSLWKESIKGEWECVSEVTS